jgi:hypothetical protein
MSVALRRPLAACAAVLVLLALLPTARAAAEPSPGYRPPVDAPVTDGFRPPEHRYGPGHRGLEYGTAPGAEVDAAADGRVVFAGLVAGALHVTVLHPDGLRTTVSYLRTVDVVVGQVVAQGDRLGTADGALFFSAREGDEYLDPAGLFAEGPPRVWLVPFDDPPGGGAGGERSTIRQLLGFGSAIARGIGGGVSGTVGWVGDHGGEALRTAAAYAPVVVPNLRAALLVATSLRVLHAAWEESHRPCTADAVPVAPPSERRIVVLVAGLGSTSSNGSIDDVDVGALGYDPADVVRLSYRGGRTPGSTGHPPGVRATSYGKADSQQDLHVVGRHLADLVEALAAAAPGVPIDVIAHSQGGLVARLGLAELERRGAVDPVDHLVTIGTPHQGAPLATHGRAMSALPYGKWAFNHTVGPRVDLDADTPTLGQLSTAGDLVHELAGTPLPAGVAATSIAGRTDLIVPAPRTRLAGARSVVIPTATADAHKDLPGDPRTGRELLLALTGAPPACRGLGEALLDQVASQAIDQVEGSFGSS